MLHLQGLRAFSVAEPTHVALPSYSRVIQTSLRLRRQSASFPTTRPRLRSIPNVRSCAALAFDFKGGKGMSEFLDLSSKSGILNLIKTVSLTMLFMQVIANMDFVMGTESVATHTNFVETNNLQCCRL